MADNTTELPAESQVPKDLDKKTFEELGTMASELGLTGDLNSKEKRVAAIRKFYDADPEEARDAAEHPVQAAAFPIIHFVADGLTLAGQVWYRGQELEVTDALRRGVTGTDGVCPLDYDKATQVKMWGEVKFEQGEWPYGDYADPRAAERERLRARRAPTIHDV